VYEMYVLYSTKNYIVQNSTTNTIRTLSPLPRLCRRFFGFVGPLLAAAGARQACQQARLALQVAHIISQHLVNLCSGLTARACCCAQGRGAGMAENSESDGAVTGASCGAGCCPIAGS
jgi:hypothetical protein